MRAVRILIEIFGYGILLIRGFGAVDELVNLDQIAFGVIFILELRDGVLRLGAVFIQTGRRIDGGDPVAVGGVAVENDGFGLFSVGVVVNRGIII